MKEAPEVKSIILGTRGSALALAQAKMAESALRAVFPDLNIKRRVIKTTGDRRTDIPLSEVARAADMDKGVFTKELEVSLQNGEIDIAVHSLKDMPSLLDEEFSIAAVLPRASRRDVLIGKESGGLKGLRHGAKVATSSVRRRRLLESMRPDLEIVDIRGNVPTRIHKLRESEELEGLLLAKAGLCRLDLLHDGVVDSGGKVLYVEELDETVFVPAAGQGAVGLEIRSGDMNALNACKKVNDGNTMRLVAAERRFLALLGAGCETPVGVAAEIEEDGELGKIRLRAVLFEDGENVPLRGEALGAGDDPEGLAVKLLAAMKDSKPS